MNSVNGSTPNFLPHNIKCLRRKLRFSQEELAQKLGLNRGNIASYENGSAEPKICNLLKFSNLFGVSIIDLTQKDMREADTFQSATENFQDISGRDLELIAEYAKKAEEIREFMEGLTKCINFKAHCKEGLSKDLRHVIDYYEQLHDASLQLIHNHQSLIDFVKCKLR